ncbi:MAG: type IV secretion system DNA-binding domain-containing protein [Sulfuritalea sp.]|nr:type IV secretion system DNA-binding domain-containing protein [Sulfuritalea sp.]MDP1984654.1 type IV secretion system DNA-binding domain-containing protein [Sulfuritalea sp.]
MTPATPLPRADWSAGLLVGAAALVAGLLIGIPLAFSLSGPWRGAGGGEFTTGNFVLDLLRGRLPVATWPLKLKLFEAAASALSLAFAALAAWATSRPRAAIVHAEGPQLRNGAAALAGVLKQEKRLSDRLFSAAGIDWHRDRFRRSLLVLGSIGGGKTQMILSFLSGLIESKHRILIVDGPKGDYSQCVAGDPLIIAPWHSGAAWDVAADTPTRGHAIALAAAIIPDSKDPLWANASRAVLIAAMCKLIATRPGEWGWPDLYTEVTRETEDLYATAREYYVPAVKLLEDAESKTTSSIMMNLAAFLLPVAELAGAWGSCKQRFSFVDWWAGRPGPQVVIIQSSAEFAALSGSYISAILTRLSMLTASPSFKESPTRKNVIVIDEFAQLPKIPGFEKFIEIGRSKGCSVVLGTQSLAQIRKTWGKDDLAAWMAMVGTKLFARTAGADDVEMVSRELGNRKVLLPMASTSVSEKGGAAAGSSSSASWQREDRPVVSQEELAALGPAAGKGVWAICQGIGTDPARILFPFINLPRLREPFIENPHFNKIVPTSATTAKPADDAPPPALAVSPEPDPAPQADPIESASLDSLLADLAETPAACEDTPAPPCESLTAPEPRSESPMQKNEFIDDAGSLSVDSADSEPQSSTDADQPETRAAEGDTEAPEAKTESEVIENIITAATGIDAQAIDLLSEIADVVTTESSGGSGDSGQAATKPTRRIRLVKKKSMQCESV